MDTLKKFFPFAYKVKKGDTAALVISIIIHFVIGFVVISLLGLIPTVLGMFSFLAWLASLLTWALGILDKVLVLYGLLGILLSVLNYFKTEE